MRRCSQVHSAKGLALAGFGTIVELDSFSETNYVTFPLKGRLEGLSHSKVITLSKELYRSCFLKGV